MRSTLPDRLLVLPAVRCASNASRPGRSSIGVYPSDSFGLVLSPVDSHRLPLVLSMTSPAPWWQHSARCTGTSRTTFSLDRSRESPVTVNRLSRSTLTEDGE